MQSKAILWPTGGVTSLIRYERGPGKRGLSLGVEDLTTAVLPRGGVDAVGAAEGAGFAVFDEFRGAELVGGTTESAAAFGLFTFRIGHGSTLG